MKEFDKKLVEFTAENENEIREVFDIGTGNLPIFPNDGAFFGRSNSYAVSFFAEGSGAAAEFGTNAVITNLEEPGSDYISFYEVVTLEKTQELFAFLGANGLDETIARFNGYRE